MILVTGATGKVGRHLVTELIGAGVPVRALTRGPGDPGLPDDAEIARWDPGQPATLAAALAGTDAVFINVTAVGGVIGELIAAASAAGTRQAVMLSSLTVHDNGVQPYAIGAHHKAIEDQVRASALAATFLRCGGFAANTLAWAPMIRAEGVVRAPYENAATAPIAEWDIATAAVRVLLDDGHAGATYVLTGRESLTQAGHAQAIGAAIGRSLRFEELTPEDFRRATAAYLPAAAADDMLRYLAQYVGRTAQMSPDLEKITGRPATAFSDWAAERAASFR
jgi:uncharacterized protein YbjT (DUF2867 family)